MASSTKNAPPPTEQRLHRAERILLMVDDALRGLGYPGFGLQLHIRLAAPVAVERLRTAILRLGQQYPVTTARLDRSDRRRPVWRLRPGAVLSLHEQTSASSGDDAILPVAEQLLATPRPLTECDPIQFVLVHAANGTATLIVQYNHVLMDSNAVLLMLAELNRLSDSPPGPPTVEVDDHRGQYLLRHSWQVRIRGAIAAARQRSRLMRRTPVMLTRERSEASAVLPTRVLLRCLDPAATKAFAVRVRHATGFRCISLALLVSSFRALRRCAPHADDDGVLVANAGMDLRDPGSDGPIFRNVASLLRFGIHPGDLDDWGECLRTLNRTMRELLARHIDVGTVQLTSLLNPNSSATRRMNERGMLQQQSLSYGYFGTSAVERQGLCGTPIERLYHVVQNWSPPGLAVVANESQGRLILAIMTTPATVPAETAERFADALVADLVAADPTGPVMRC
jgi:hypothetical protein